MIDKVRQGATALAVYALAGGLVSLLAWILDVPRLADWLGLGISTQPNTAVAAVAAAASLLALFRGRRILAAALGGLVGVIGLTVLVEYAFGVSLGIDSLLRFGRTWGDAGVVYPGRMGPPGAVSWSLLGVGLLLAAKARKARVLVPVLASTTLAVSLLSLIGYLYGARVFYSLPWITVIAFQTSTFVFALSLGLIAAVPERAPMRALLEEGAAGALVRRALPAALALPIVLGFLRLRSQRAGLYDLDFGTALRTLVEMGLLVGVLAWTAANVRRQSRLASERGRMVEAIDHRLAGVIGSLTDPFVMVDRDWRFTFLNDVATTALRKRADELIGTELWAAFPEAVQTVAYVELQRAMKERISVEYEAFYPPWKRWYFAKAYPAADGGVALFFRDVTDRKLDEEALRESRYQLQRDLAAMTRLQALSTQLVPATERSSLLGRILTAAAEITGTDKANIQIHDPATGTLRIAAHQGHGPDFLSHFAERGCDAICGRAAESHERIVVEDVLEEPDLVGTQDGEVLAAEGIRAVVSTPVVSLDGRLLGVLNTQFGHPHRPPADALRWVDLLARMAADVLERTEIEQALRESENAERAARGEAERASAFKDEFLATLSHELRTPMNAILGWVRVLERRGDDPALAREGVQVIARNAKSQSDLIADLLDMSRIISGKIRLEIATVDLSAVIQSAIETMRPAADAKKIEMAVLVDPDADSIRGDAGRLRQVVANLLANAVKFTPKGGRVDVSLTKAGSSAEIAVRDSGVGIAPRFLPYVFERFRQGDASTTREQGGLGLGLAIVKQLVELHGGTVRADSAGTNRGATFTIALPLALMHLVDDDAIPRSARAGAQPTDDIDLDGVTVLAVEDQKDARELLRLVLERSHARVYTAGSVDEALVVLERARPDVILCDIGMPGKDGYAFISELRRRHDATPALAVTAFARTEDKIRALRAGFHAHVAKPIEPDELLSTLAVFVRGAKH